MLFGWTLVINLYQKKIYKNNLYKTRFMQEKLYKQNYTYYTEKRLYKKETVQTS